MICMPTTDEYLDAGLRGWIFNQARINKGRVANYDFEDYVQEALLAYSKCRERYVGKRGLKKRDGTPCRYLPPKHPDAEARRHFAALVQTTFTKRLSTLALKQPKGWEQSVADLTEANQTEEQTWDRLLPVVDEEAILATLLQNAPQEFMQLFALLLEDALVTYYAFSIFPDRRRLRLGRARRAPRETSNQRFCRLLGLSPDRDIYGEVERYFCG